MLAVRTGGEGKAVVDPAAEIPTRGADEALIKILRAGICNTDLEILKGYMGFQGVLGHEFVGVVRIRFLAHLVYQPKSLLQSCIVRHRCCNWHWCHWRCHLCTPPPGTRLDVETSYLVYIIIYAPPPPPHVCTSNI